MSDFQRCRTCGNPVDPEQVKAHDGACPWCLAAFAFAPESEPPAGPPLPGSKPFGKYVRTEKLGSGGMGEVWKALDTELNRWVALKFLKEEDPRELARFQREARLAARLSHPNIAAIYEVGEIDGRRFIAMQHVSGRTLETFPRDDRKALVRLVRDAARAVDHAHRQGIIHRDLKPGNLMVAQDGKDWRVVVLDFGLARPIEGGESLSLSGSVIGTPAYMSPEQARSEKLDERADVYSLGATLYEILTGKPPFEGTNVYEVLKKIEGSDPIAPRRLNPSVPRDLETIVLKCLEKDRHRRYGSAGALADDLDRFLNHEAILARPASTIYRLRMKLAKRKAVAASVGVAILAVVAVIGAWRFHWKPQRDHSRYYDEGMKIREEMLRLSFAPQVDRDRLRRKAAEARALFDQANACVETPQTHVMRGRCLEMEGKSAEALAAFERATSFGRKTPRRESSWPEPSSSIIGSCGQLWWPWPLETEEFGLTCLTWRPNRRPHGRCGSGPSDCSVKGQSRRRGRICSRVCWPSRGGSSRKPRFDSPGTIRSTAWTFKPCASRDSAGSWRRISAAPLKSIRAC